MQIISAIVRDISIVVGVFVAIRGINAWKREYVGKRRIDLAEEVYSLFCQAKDAIAAIRSPLGFTGEGATRARSENESAEEKRIYDRAYATIERYQRYQKLFGRLFSLQYRFALQFGEKYNEPFDEIRKNVNHVLLTAHTIGDMWFRGPGPTAEPDKAREWYNVVEKEQSIIWDSGKQDDPIRPAVEKAVEAIGEACRKAVGAYQTQSRFRLPSCVRWTQKG